MKSSFLTHELYAIRTVTISVILCISMGNCLSLPLYAEDQNTTGYRKLILKAQESLQQKQFLEAMSIAEQAIAKDPTQYEAFSLIAIAATRLGQKEIAITAISQAVELANRQERMKLFPVWIKIDKKSAEQAAQERVENATSAYADGLAYKAGQLLEEAWRLNPEKTDWGLRAARAYIGIKKYIPGIPLLREVSLSNQKQVALEAEKQMQQISPLIDTLYREHMQQATEFLAQGKADAAEKSWMDGVTIDPFRPDAYYELSKLYLAQDDQKRALNALKNAIRNGERDPKRIKNKSAFFELWGNSEYLQLIESMFGPDERNRISKEFHAETELNDPEYELGLNLYLGKGMLMNRERAYQLFHKSADRGNTLAKTFVAFQYSKGEHGVQQDDAEASRWFDSSMPALKKLAEEGNPVAQNNLADMYYEGYAVRKDLKEAVKWLRASAKQDYPPAQNNLGFMYGSGEGVEQDTTEALKWYRKAAEQNYAPAQDALGHSYLTGWGVEKNIPEALNWYRKAAEKNYASAQNKLGRIYYIGEDVEENIPEATKWYRKAAEQNHLEAQVSIGKILERDGSYPEAITWYRKAAEQNYKYGQYCLGSVYYTGHGVNKDHTQAAYWHRKAAEQGLPQSQYELAMQYYKGEGVKQDYNFAFKWLRDAASQNYASAQNSLGYMYGNGLGVKQNHTESMNWYQKAAEQGNSAAQNNIGMKYYNAEGVKQDYYQAFSWFRKAAVQNNARAQYHLGYMYEKGRGVEKNLIEAVGWYRNAMKNGYPDAKDDLRRLGYSP